MMLEKMVALVTGGSRGIGRAICLKLASMGARVGINYVANPAAAEETLKQIEAAGGKGFTVRFDVADADAVRWSVGQIRGPRTLPLTLGVRPCALSPRPSRRSEPRLRPGSLRTGIRR